jgi:hypothetical protein
MSISQVFHLFCYQEQKQILDKYIPGLHRPGIDYPELPTIKPKKPNPIPDSLISDFHSGRKNAVSSALFLNWNADAFVNNLHFLCIEVNLCRMMFFNVLFFVE